MIRCVFLAFLLLPSLLPLCHGDREEEPSPVTLNSPSSYSSSSSLPLLLSFFLFFIPLLLFFSLAPLPFSSPLLPFSTPCPPPPATVIPQWPQMMGGRERGRETERLVGIQYSRSPSSLRRSSSLPSPLTPSHPVCLSVHPSIRTPVFFVHPSVCLTLPSLCLHFVFQSVHLSSSLSVLVHTALQLSVGLLVCLSVRPYSSRFWLPSTAGTVPLQRVQYVQ